jgi:hypothetical protein
MTYKLDDDLRILILKDDVLNLPVPADYAFQLLSSIDKYRDQLLARPIYEKPDLWDDLEALQQVTLGDILETRMLEIFERESNHD